MPNEHTPLPERVLAYYSKLSTVAADLNAISDALGKSITDIDDALKQLNLGISVWVKVYAGEGDHYEDNSFWSRDIGYAKVDGRWGISLRKVEGDYSQPDKEVVEQWAFNEAPRSLRLEAIEKIPELLEKLTTEAVKTTKEIQDKLGDAQSVATAVKQAARETTTKRQTSSAGGMTPPPLPPRGRK